MKKRFRKSTAVLMAVVMMAVMIAIAPITVNAISKTADEAILWCQSKIGQGVEYSIDEYRYQCVDFIQAYYSYLGVSPSWGSGYQYATNTLPAGWERKQGGKPQKGDILVYTGGYGHVAIYESDNVSYHQNWGGPYVQRVERYYGNSVWVEAEGVTKTYWGCIHPDFAATDTIPPSVSRISFDNFTSTGYTLHFNVSDNNSLSFVRVYTWTSDTPQKSDDISLSGTSKDISYNVRYSDFKNETSGYIHAIWCFDTAGNRGDSDYIYVDNGVHLPYGYLDIAEVVGNQVHVKGWAYDNDAPSISIDVHVYIGDELHVIKADKDLDPGVVSYTGYHNHCFDAYFPSNKEGSQTVNAYGININRMGNVLYQGNNLLLQSGKNISLPMNGPEISDVTISQVSSKGFSITCRVSDPSGISKVQFPTWCDTVNQTDLIWYEGTIIKGTATVYVPASDHNNSQGRYAGRIYAYDSLGNCTIDTIPWVSLTDAPIELHSTHYKGKTYRLFNSGKCWTEAKEWCEEQGGHLVTVEDEDEWEIIKLLWKRNGAFPIWLGAESTSGKWRWVTGEEMTYTHWSNGEPNCDSGIEYYLGTGKGSGFLGCDTWNDYPDGNYQGGFICEYDNFDFDLSVTVDNDQSEITMHHNSIAGATIHTFNIYNSDNNRLVQSTSSIPDTELFIKLNNGHYYINITTDNGFVSNDVYFIINKAYIGDADRDGYIGVKDVTAIQRHIAEFELFSDEQIALADVNKDGVVTIDDATLIQMYLAEYDVTLG